MTVNPALRSRTGLDEDAAELIRLAAASGRPPMETLPVEQARATYRDVRRQMSSGGPAMAEVRDVLADGPDCPIPLRLYRPHGVDDHRPAPALIFCHGGGWVLGDLDTHDTACRVLADASEVVVVAVDYRLAPEHKFPSAVDDAVAAAEWIAGPGADVLGIDPGRLAIGGDSAGATLATVAAITARDRGQPRFSLQLLVYPASDLRRMTRSQELFKSGYVLTESMQEWLTGLYLRDAAEITDWRASPLFATDLSGLPPAWILTAGFDPLRDEGLAYATRLIEAGTSVTLRHYPGQIHGFITLGNQIRQAQEALEDAALALRSAL